MNSAISGRELSNTVESTREPAHDVPVRAAENARVADWLVSAQTRPVRGCGEIIIGESIQDRRPSDYSLASFVNLTIITL